MFACANWWATPPSSPDAAKHAGKAIVDEKAVDPGGVAGQDDVQGLRRFARDTGRKSKTVARPHGDDPDPDFLSLQRRCGRCAHRSVAAADHHNGYPFLFDQGNKKVIITCRWGR